MEFVNSFEDEDNMYILLELCEGGELYHYIRKCSLSLEKVRGISRQIALALKYLHEQKIMHRDLKLGNILLTTEHKIVIFPNFLHILLIFSLENLRFRLSDSIKSSIFREKHPLRHSELHFAVFLSLFYPKKP